MIIQLIDEAVANGARREHAAALLGLSDRAIARWRVEADSDDRRQGPHAAPAHKLDSEGRARVARWHVVHMRRANQSYFRRHGPLRVFGLRGLPSEDELCPGSPWLGY